MTLTGFPLDSTQIGYHEDGLPAYSSEYSSKNYRDVLAALISDGVIARVGNALKVEFADEQQHMNATASLTMTSGAAVKGGCMCITKGETVSVTAPQITGDETVATKRTAIGIAFYGDGLSESTTADESVEIDVKSSSGQPSYASNALYMAEVISKTVKHSGGTYSYSHEIQDLRASEHCGFSAPFVDIDLSSFYDNVNEAINSYSMEIIENIALLKGWTQTAVELAQDALEGVDLGNIYIRLDDLETELDAKQFGTSQIMNGAITDEKIASQAVITETLADGAVTNSKIASNSISSNNLDDELNKVVYREAHFNYRQTTDLLLVDTSSSDTNANMPCMIATNDASTIVNRAPSMPSSGSFIAYREVRRFSQEHLLVIVTEAFPHPGRTWYCLYNTNNWGAWYVNTPSISS